jgi:hypothetical protein
MTNTLLHQVQNKLEKDYSANGIYFKTTHEVVQKKVGRVGDLEIGLFSWSESASPNRDFFEVVAFVALTDTAGRILSLIYLKEGTSDLNKLYETRRRELPKKHWWQFASYVEEQIKIALTPGEALADAHKWAETRVGISKEQQEVIDTAIEVVKVRNQVVNQLLFKNRNSLEKKLNE